MPCRVVILEQELLKPTVMSNDNVEMDICSPSMTHAVSMCTMAKSIVREYATSKCNVRYMKWQTAMHNDDPHSY